MDFKILVSGAVGMLAGAIALGQVHAAPALAATSSIEEKREAARERATERLEADEHLRTIERDLADIRLDMRKLENAKASPGPASAGACTCAAPHGHGRHHRRHRH